MTQLANTFEGGTDGVAVTTANSGGASGDPFDAVSGSGDFIRHFTNVQARDTLALRVATRTTATTPYVAYDASYGTEVDEFGRVYFLNEATTPANDLRIVAFFDDSAVQKATIQLRTLRTLIVEAVGIGITHFTTVLAIDTWYRIEWHFDTAATTLTVRLYEGDSTTLLEEKSRTDVPATTSVGLIRMGIQLSIANHPTATTHFYFDNAKVDAGDWPGPAVTVDMQQARPDADVTTTGWTTTPLWSKVEEDPASDTDFITSTAV